MTLVWGKTDHRTSSCTHVKHASNAEVKNYNFRIRDFPNYIFQDTTYSLFDGVAIMCLNLLAIVAIVSLPAKFVISIKSWHYYWGTSETTRARRGKCGKERLRSENLNS